MSDQSNRSVNIGGNATGNIIQAGNNNVASLTQTTLPPAESVDIKAELAALREVLASLKAPDQKKIDRALEDVDDELAKPEPDRDEVGGALERALDYASKAEEFASTTGKLQQHISGAVSWLGDNWHKILGLVGLTV